MKMPKQTYFNLPEDKQDRIFQAGLLEFSYHNRHDASVNTIVNIANISKGSFYQYFEDKDEFYWFVLMEIIFGNITTYETLLKRFDGDFLQAGEALFLKILDLFDDTRYRHILTHAYQSSFTELIDHFSEKASTIYFKMYDVLMKFGFKGYNIQSKEDFLIAFQMTRNIANFTILTMIKEGLTKQKTKDLYYQQMEVLSNGIRRRGWFS